MNAVENLSIENTSDQVVEIVANRVSGIAERAKRKASPLLMGADTPRRGVPLTRTESG